MRPVTSLAAGDIEVPSLVTAYLEVKESCHSHIRCGWYYFLKLITLATSAVELVVVIAYPFTSGDIASVLGYGCRAGFTVFTLTTILGEMLARRANVITHLTCLGVLVANSWLDAGGGAIASHPHFR